MTKHHVGHTFVRHRPGKIIPLFVVLLPALCGMAGLVVDTGLLLAAHRQVQNAADSAALAGAHRLLRGDTNNTARTEAINFVTNYNGLTNATVTVNIGPTQGSYAGQSKYVEVHVSNTVATAFLGAVGISTSTVSARAVAGVESARINEAGVLFDSTSFPGLKLESGATLTVNGSLVLNSPGAGYDQYGNWLSWGSPYPAYALELGSGATLKAKYLQIKGGVNSVSSIQNYTTGGSMPLYSAAGTAADPGLSLPVPMTSNVTSITNWTRQAPMELSAASGTTLYPGVYQDISIINNAVVTFSPGVYIFCPQSIGQGLRISGNPTITGNGVMFYFTGNTYLSPSPGYYDNLDGGVNLNSDGWTVPWPPDPNFTTMAFAQLRINTTNATINLSGLSDNSSPFNNVLFFQRRRPPYDYSPYSPAYGFQLVNGGTATVFNLSGFAYCKWGGCILGQGTYGAHFTVGTMTINSGATATINTGTTNYGAAKQVFLVE